MLRIHRASRVALIAALLAGFVAAGAPYQSMAAGKIICWKDKNGKVVGCGDRVPPEYQDAATKELDKRGITRKTTETAEEKAKREAQEKATAGQKADEKKRLAEQQRQDSALMNTFSNEKEIDLKRDRDLAVVDGQMTQLRLTHKNASDRQKEARARYDDAAKGKTPPSAAVKDELARADAAAAKAAANLATKEKEKEEIRQRYADMKARYIQLKGGGSAAAAKK